MLSSSALRDAPNTSGACAASEDFPCLFRCSLPDTSVVEERDERILLGGASDPLAAEARAVAILERGLFLMDEPYVTRRRLRECDSSIFAV
jgi:hypothetical protein